MKCARYAQIIFLLLTILSSNCFHKAVAATEDICRLVAKSENTERLIKQQKADNTILNFNSIDCNGKNLMEVALADSPYFSYVSDIRPGRYDNVLWLLNNGFDINLSNANGNTPLHLVAKKGDINLIYLFVEHGADLNAQNQLGETPLSLSIQSNPEAFNLLLHLGADLKIKDNSGKRVIDVAIYQRQPELVEILFQHGVEPSQTLLKYARKNIKQDLSNRREAQQIVSLIKEYKELRTLAIFEGDNARQLTFNPPQLRTKQFLPSKQDPPIVEATRKNDIDTVRRLIAQGVNVDVISRAGSINDDEFNATALHIAFSSGYTDIASVLIKSGANLTIQNGAGHHPLFLAANDLNLSKLILEHIKLEESKLVIYKQTALLSDRLNSRVANLLIAKGADINYQNKYGYTPLHYAVFNKNVFLTELFLNKNAKVNVGNSVTETPLYYATRNNQPTIVDMLLEKGANMGLDESYELAISNGSKEIELALKQAGANYRDKKTFFQQAVISQQTVVVEKLLNEGFDSYVKTDEGSKSLGIINHPNANYKIVELLIKHGANVNVVLKNGETPLHLASELGYFKIAKLLLESGANIEIKDDFGRTPLYMAVRGPIYLRGKMASDWSAPDYNKKLPEYTKIVRLFIKSKPHLKINVRTSFGSIEESIKDLKDSQNENLKNFAEEINIIINSNQTRIVVEGLD